MSALPEHAVGVRRLAEWVAARRTRAGLEHATVLDTNRHPVIYADFVHAPGKPTVLLYSHLDVQPVDPVNEWEMPPFEPTGRDDRLNARGASDMKSGVVAMHEPGEPVVDLGALRLDRGQVLLAVRSGTPIAFLVHLAVTPALARLLTVLG